MMKIQFKKKRSLCCICSLSKDPLEFRFSAEKVKWSRGTHALHFSSSKKVIVACDYHLYKSVAHFCILRNGHFRSIVSCYLWHRATEFICYRLCELIYSSRDYYKSCRFWKLHSKLVNHRGHQGQFSKMLMAPKLTMVMWLMHVIN